ncbi:MAG: bifunctional diaminohydroxyphosphoribosylaminopyrimidine deaminase/5-amino-6-(5-phosphoribosylamino)uracil reductase RibD [Candidatus Eisenbacteria bacterium]|nr:bifunctional diaminohydroxyphosphoribosylaminopyrimidine deaminase/5-amino-6-(5-phosphoribosylamino)uracil reductase RibD [Candidatus Eisenbacteria bacterium]
MRRALRLAAKGRGDVSPNPMVGAVLVRGGRVIGEGWHRAFGGTHAEVEAIRAAGRAGGATLYVTLEPCAHQGRTPPCVDAIRDAGISRVVVAMRDPNPKVVGGGLEVLASRGVTVFMGPSAAEAAELNRGFISCVTRGRPFVTLKMAASLDGGIATANGHSRWITSPLARKAAHRLRAEHDAVLVGAATVIADDPALTVRDVRGRNPIRMVLDPSLRSSPRAAWLKRDGVRRIVVALASAPAARRKAFEAAGAEVWIGSASPDRTSWRGIRIAALLKQAAKGGITSILVEGGGRVAGAFLAAKCADRLALFTAPMLLGGDSIRWTTGLGVSRVDRAPRLSNVTIRKLGPDWLVTGDL